MDYTIPLKIVQSHYGNNVIVYYFRNRNNQKPFYTQKPLTSPVSGYRPDKENERFYCNCIYNHQGGDFFRGYQKGRNVSSSIVGEESVFFDRAALKYTF